MKVVKINYNNKEFQKKLIKYVQWIDNPPKECIGDYDFFRKKIHKELFDFFKILRHTEEGDKLELYINKFIISMSTSVTNKKLAMVNACQTQEELDQVEKQLEFLKKWESK